MSPTRKRLSPEADVVHLALHARGWSDRRVGAALGITHNSVMVRRRRLGLPPNPARGWVGRHAAPDVAALAKAGWPWPCPGLPAVMTPRHLRILLTLLDGGMMTAAEVGRMIGSSSQIGGGHGSLGRLRAEGMVMVAVPSGRTLGVGGSTPSLYAIAPYALDLIAKAQAAGGSGVRP